MIINEVNNEKTAPILCKLEPGTVFTWEWVQEKDLERYLYMKLDGDRYVTLLTGYVNDYSPQDESDVILIKGSFITQ